MESFRAFRLLEEPHAVTQELLPISSGQKHHFPIQYLAMHKTQRLIQWLRNTVMA